MSQSATVEWFQTIAKIMDRGNNVSPRGQATFEIPQHTVEVDMARPVMTYKPRRLQYKFMAAEAYWILTGDNRVETIAPYNRHISQFSDDHNTFAGAYGPRVIHQLKYVIDKLSEDNDTRQATMTIWTPNPQPSKDIPCTVAVDFKIREGKLNVHVFMRSSDAWLGLPYDIFNFSMLGALVCGYVNFRRHVSDQIDLGTLYLTAASSHLYERNFEAVRECLNLTLTPFDQHPMPDHLWKRKVVKGSLRGDENTPRMLLDYLADLRDDGPGSPLRWWEEDNVAP